MDISNIISNNIDGYLKPKYPIYKITYIHTKMKYNHEDGHGEPYIKTRSKIGIFEYVNDSVGGCGIDFEECKVSENVIDEINENDYYVIKDEFYSNETWTIIHLEQLA